MTPLLNLSPLLIVVLLVAGLSLIGLIDFLVRQHRTFQGYRAIKPQVREIGSRLNADVFRDGSDLVISGQYDGSPTLLRFSNDENTPGMHLEMRISSNLHLSMMPKNAVEAEVGTKVALSPWLERRFTAKSKTPGDVDLLLKHSQAMSILPRLCSSSNTSLRISPGQLELTEAMIPESPLTRVFEQLTEIRHLQRAMQSLPGADTLKVVTIPREHSSWTLRAAMVAGIIVAALCISASMKERPPVMAAASQPSSGIASSDKPLIPFADKWHLADNSDFDPAFSNFVADSGQRLTSRIVFDPDGTGDSGVAYLLTNDAGQKRLVMIVNHHSVLDTSFPQIAGVTRVRSPYFGNPKQDENERTTQTSGQAILLVRNVEDTKSAVLFYLQNGTLQSKAPSDYRNVQLD